MITSASHRRWPGDIEILDMRTAGLPAASAVRSAKIATIEARDGKQIGRLPKPDRLAVRGGIVKLISAVLETGEEYAA